jgi:bifunctional DNA-binding transcriptional regulator/antitoxin component of YhaV-PrlF toxin-antitoxin module
VFVPSDINTIVRGGILIKISEISYTIGDDGRLVIPADDLTEMGLTAGQDVLVAYITDDDLANRYHEFTVSAVSLSELDTTQQIAIPQQLLEQAGIDSHAEVQIACIDGAIIITGDTPLTEDELSEVIGRLRAVNDLTEHFPDESDSEEGGTSYGSF